MYLVLLFIDRLVVVIEIFVVVVVVVFLIEMVLDDCVMRVLVGEGFFVLWYYYGVLKLLGLIRWN